MLLSKLHRQFFWASVRPKFQPNGSFLFLFLFSKMVKIHGYLVVAVARETRMMLDGDDRRMGFTLSQKESKTKGQNPFLCFGIGIGLINRTVPATNNLHLLCAKHLVICYGRNELCNLPISIRFKQNRSKALCAHMPRLGGFITSCRRGRFPRPYPYRRSEASPTVLHSTKL